MAALAFSSCSEQGLLFIASHYDGLSCFRAQALGKVAAHGLSSCNLQALEQELSNCGAQVQLLHSMWDLPRPAIKPVSPALAGFLITGPPVLCA